MTNKPPFAQKQSLFAAFDEVKINTSSASSPSSDDCLSTTQPRLIFSAIFKNENRFQELHLNDSNMLSVYLRMKLDVFDINKIDKYLWIANQKRASRTLHHQILIDRRVIIVKNFNLHLLWIDARLFVKSLPDFLLCYDIWKRISREPNLFVRAASMLHSYIWLIRSKSDLRCVQLYLFCVRDSLKATYCISKLCGVFLQCKPLLPQKEYLSSTQTIQLQVHYKLYDLKIRFSVRALSLTRMNDRIAHSENLLSAHLEWKHWTSLARVAYTRINSESLQSVNSRYHYGELRLSRINWCWSFSQIMSISSLVRGYFNVYHDYETWFKRHIVWITDTIAYVALVLTAMQIDLRTDRLRTNRAFQDASYAFTIFAIVAPLETFFDVSLDMIFMIFYNWRYTIRLKRERKQAPWYLRENEATKTWEH